MIRRLKVTLVIEQADELTGLDQDGDDILDLVVEHLREQMNNGRWQGETAKLVEVE